MLLDGWGMFLDGWGCLMCWICMQRGRGEGNPMLPLRCIVGFWNMGFERVQFALEVWANVLVLG